jgi:hypothetical protein
MREKGIFLLGLILICSSWLISGCGSSNNTGNTNDPSAFTFDISNITDNTADISWSEYTPSDNLTYHVYKNDTLVIITTNESYSLTGLVPNTLYEIKLLVFEESNKVAEASMNRAAAPPIASKTKTATTLPIGTTTLLHLTQDYKLVAPSSGSGKWTLTVHFSSEHISDPHYSSGAYIDGVKKAWGLSHSPVTSFVLYLNGDTTYEVHINAYAGSDWSAPIAATLKFVVQTQALTPPEKSSLNTTASGLPNSTAENFVTIFKNDAVIKDVLVNGTKVTAELYDNVAYRIHLPTFLQSGRLYTADASFNDVSLPKQEELVNFKITLKDDNNLVITYSENSDYDSSKISDYVFDSYQKFIFTIGATVGPIKFSQSLPWPGTFETISAFKDIAGYDTNIYFKQIALAMAQGYLTFLQITDLPAKLAAQGLSDPDIAAICQSYGPNYYVSTIAQETGFIQPSAWDLYQFNTAPKDFLSVNDYVPSSTSSYYGFLDSVSEDDTVNSTTAKAFVASSVLKGYYDAGSFMQFSDGVYEGINIYSFAKKYTENNSHIAPTLTRYEGNNKLYYYNSGIILMRMSAYMYNRGANGSPTVHIFNNNGENPLSYYLELPSKKSGFGAMYVYQVPGWYILLQRAAKSSVTNQYSQPITRSDIDTYLSTLHGTLYSTEIYTYIVDNILDTHFPQGYSHDYNSGQFFTDFKEFAEAVNNYLKD